MLTFIIKLIRYPYYKTRGFYRKSKRAFVALLRALVNSVDDNVAKSANVWAFPVCYLNQRFYDNARAVFEEVINDESIKKVVLYRTRKPDVIASPHVLVMKLYSPRGFYWLMKSGVVFVRHCIIQDIGFPINYQKRKVVNLWHGITLKKIGVQSSSDSITGCDPFTSIISSSSKDQRVLASLA